MIRAKLGTENYVAFNARQLVMQLKLEDWTTYNTTKEYQKNVKKRVRNFSGDMIRYANDEEFLRELHRIGVIEELSFDESPFG